MILNTMHVSSCQPCTLSSSCSTGYYLSGQCSNFSNPVCMKCRPQCGPAEIEVQACTKTTDRRCLPSPSCYSSCPAGTYETRKCSPPNLVQLCSPCAKCGPGTYVNVTCSGSTNTQCATCPPPHCPSDVYNANFGPPAGCSGSETVPEEAVKCAVTTESYGENCSPNFYRVQVHRIVFLDALLLLLLTD